jgi:FixJ family two-component response regulator
MGLSKPVVYVVDDEEVIAETLAFILNQAGYSASPFGEAEQALAAAASRTPDLLISDIAMPLKSGVELGMQFQRSYPQCKVLLISGHADSCGLLEESRQQGYEFDFLYKPVHPADLLARLQERSFIGGQGKKRMDKMLEVAT